MSELVATLKVARGGAMAATYERFEVPYQSGASILDGLIWIRENLDPTLAFRFSCISANVCKECVMRVDGRVGYACTERLKPGETILEPLPNKRIMRDLACDTVPPKERL